MLGKYEPLGYFSRVSKLSKGPWFEEAFVEEDGLEWYYQYKQANQKVTLLSNNIPLEDREQLDRLFRGIDRNRRLSWFVGLCLSFETFQLSKTLNKAVVAPGWRFLAIFGLGFAYKTAFSYWNAYTYGPLVSAYLKKYKHFAKSDIYDIQDEKRQYFELDTSVPMGYGYEDLNHHHQVNHGPQPDGEALDSSWLIEVDKFLRGEENNLKNHPRFIDIDPSLYIDKSYPTPEMAQELFTKNN